MSISLFSEPKYLQFSSEEYCLSPIALSSFHVGSGCQTPSAYQSALELSQEVFQYASHIGYNFTLLDIGGGFPGHQGSDGLFSQVSASINQGLDKFFNPERFPDLKIIAEPGVCA